MRVFRKSGPANCNHFNLPRLERPPPPQLAYTGPNKLEVGDVLGNINKRKSCPPKTADVNNRYLCQAISIGQSHYRWRSRTSAGRQSLNCNCCCCSSSNNRTAPQQHVAGVAQHILLLFAVAAADRLVLSGDRVFGSQFQFGFESARWKLCLLGFWSAIVSVFGCRKFRLLIAIEGTSSSLVRCELWCVLVSSV